MHIRKGKQNKNASSELSVFRIRMLGRFLSEHLYAQCGRLQTLRMATQNFVVRPVG